MLGIDEIMEKIKHFLAYLFVDSETGRYWCFFHTEITRLHTVPGLKQLDTLPNG